MTDDHTGGVLIMSSASLLPLLLYRIVRGYYWIRTQLVIQDLSAHKFMRDLQVVSRL